MGKKRHLYLMEKLKLINVERMREIEKSSLGKHQIDHCLWQYPSLIGGWNSEEHQNIMMVSKFSSPRYLSVAKEKMVAVNKPLRLTLTKLSALTLSIIRYIDLMHHQKTEHHFFVILAKYWRGEKELSFVTLESSILTGYCKAEERQNYTQILYCGRSL